MGNWILNEDVRCAEFCFFFVWFLPFGGEGKKREREEGVWDHRNETFGSGMVEKRVRPSSVVKSRVLRVGAKHCDDVAVSRV